MSAPAGGVVGRPRVGTHRSPRLQIEQIRVSAHELAKLRLTELRTGLVPAPPANPARVKKIVIAVTKLADNPRPHGVQSLATRPGEYRIRIGDYRVVYEIHDDRLIVLVAAVGRSSRATNPRLGRKERGPTLRRAEGWPPL